MLIVKPLTIPFKILMDSALLNRLPQHHSKIRFIEDDLTRRKVGFRGEQTLLYHLGFLKDDHYLIFFDLRLQFEEYFFQIDTLILTPHFILIIEVKNFSGTLIFEKHSGQFIRIYQNKEESFPNPLFQVQRHHFLLENLFKQKNLPTIPIEHIVVISNSTTYIKTPSDNLQLYEKVLHSEKIIHKIDQLSRKHNQIKLKSSSLKKISQFLLQNHIPDTPSILELFEIQKEEVIKGIQCSSCKKFTMIRKHGKWSCPFCIAQSKNAHEQAILDYLLLIEPTITNKKCQDFILLSNRKIVTNLLTALNLPFSGKDRYRKYHLPPVEYFQDTI